jgi:hypothetical protein
MSRSRSNRAGPQPGLDQLDHLVGMGPAGQRQLLGDRGVVVVVVVVGLAPQLAQPLPGLGAQGLDRVGPAPQALEQDQPSRGGDPTPGGERGTRVGQRPEQVPLDHGVEGPGRRLLGGSLDHLDLEAVAAGALGQALQHPAGQVEGGHPVAEPGRGQRQEPGPGADVQHPAPLAAQEPVQGGVPGGPLGRRPGPVVGGVVVGGRVSVPPGADLVGQLAVPAGRVAHGTGGRVLVTGRTVRPAARSRARRRSSRTATTFSS